MHNSVLKQVLPVFGEECKFGKLCGKFTYNCLKLQNTHVSSDWQSNITLCCTVVAAKFYSYCFSFLASCHQDVNLAIVITDVSVCLPSRHKTGGLTAFTFYQNDYLL